VEKTIQHKKVTQLTRIQTTGTTNVRLTPGSQCLKKEKKELIIGINTGVWSIWFMKTLLHRFSRVVAASGLDCARDITDPDEPVPTAAIEAGASHPRLF
jgi:hypothetical protein